MKKTVTINLNGIMYHIDEDAYQTLQSYLESLKSIFSEDESADEILSDIESRISELLEIKRHNQNQVVTINDIHEIIDIIGKPEDFGVHAKKQSTEQFTNKQSYKRLYRDTEERILGGVCGGIAYYFNVDVVIVRILFACTFFFAGPLLYLIAWIIIPKATTTTQKLEMKGKRYDIDSIIQNVKEEFEDVKSRFSKYEKEFHRKHQEKKKNSYKCESKNTIYPALVGLSLLMRSLVFILIFCSICIGLFLWAGFSWEWTSLSTFFHTSINALQSLGDFIFSSESHKTYSFIGLFIILSIPVFLIIWAIFIMLGIRGNKKNGEFLLFLIWIIGVGFFITSGVHVVSEFNYKSSSQKTYTRLPHPQKDFIIIAENTVPNKICATNIDEITTIKD